MDVKIAGVIAACYSIPASLFRIVGGWLSDRYGARIIMYWTFGVLNDVVGIWTSCFMLLFVIVALSLAWMHFAIRRMERRQYPELVSDTALPEIINATAGQRGR